jgi:DnaJ like chaperone protein
MAKYEKWLGAGLGWLLTGNPIGGFLGFIAGTFVEPAPKPFDADGPTGVSEFEANLMVLASHLIKIDGTVSHAEIEFTENFLNTYFVPQFAAERRRIFHHCLQKEYDLNNVCTEIRRYTQPATRIQVLRFMFDLALSDGELNERENYFIFKIAGFLKVNDSDFLKLREEH